ncbi:MAG TPA: hypothetical protein VHX13_01730 [Acidobacteriaceae bacterium]|nr:hypothetical protein [Acidobacteriaceae bacterium]
MPAAVPATPAAASAAPGTPSFVQVLKLCRKRPSLLARELLWRWLYGVPLLAVILREAMRIGAETSAAVQATGVDQFSLEYPMRGALAFTQAWAIVWTPVVHVLAWLLPVAMLGWAVAAGLGRNLLVRGYDRTQPWRPGPMIVLQLLRVSALFTMVALWFGAIRWAANFSISGVPPASETMAEPSLVLYCGLVIVISLGTIAVWLLLSWVFSLAPLISLLERRGVGASLARSLHLGPMAGKLVEINLVMGFLKLASTVAVMVLSVTPTAFIVSVQGIWLYLWWGVVSVLYLVVSDFFQVARVVAYVQLWGTYGVAAAPVSLQPSDSLTN